MSQASEFPPLAIVAEDEAMVRLVTVDMLEEAGFNVIEVGDAMAALDHLSRHPHVTLLFTDIDMPGTPAVKAAVVLPMGCQAAIGLG